MISRFEKNVYIYIPKGIAPYQFGQLFLFSFDNIDILEETIDGKNKFHSTRIVMLQRGSPAPREYTTHIIVRDRVYNQERHAKMHKRDRTPTRSVISGAVDLGRLYMNIFIFRLITQIAQLALDEGFSTYT